MAQLAAALERSEERACDAEAKHAAALTEAQIRAEKAAEMADEVRLALSRAADAEAKAESAVRAVHAVQEEAESMRARDAAELGRLSAALKRSEEAVGIAEAALTDEAELRARADSETAAAQCELTALHEASQRAASEQLRVREQAELRVQRAEASEAQVSGRLQCLRCAQHRDWAHPCQHLHQDWLTPGTSAPELGLPLPHAGTGPAPAHVCTGNGPTPATSAPGLGCP